MSGIRVPTSAIISHHCSELSFRTGSGRRAFTTLELLVVIGMISILLGLLLPVIPAVKRYSRKATAKAEVKSIEAAWKLYYQEYKKWPTFASEGAPIAIEDDVARTIDGTSADSNNIRQLQFMDFSRYNDATNPINPWGNSLSAAADSSYYVAFDMNFDNIIISPLSNSVRRSVIVWTKNPDITDGSDERIIGSWQE